MAVHFDATTLRSIVGDDLYDAGSTLLDSVSGLEEADGGVFGHVAGSTGAYEVWAGIVDHAFTGECSAGDARDGEPCAHVVALALAGILAGVRWSARTSQKDTGDQADLLRLVDGLDRGDLVELVVAHAAASPAFAAAVRARAGG